MIQHLALGRCQSGNGLGKIKHRTAANAYHPQRAESACSGSCGLHSRQCRLTMASQLQHRDTCGAQRINQPGCPQRVRAMNQNTPHAKPRNQAERSRRPSAPEQDPTGATDIKRDHTAIVAATARPHCAYLTARLPGSIAGSNRRSNAQFRAKAS